LSRTQALLLGTLTVGVLDITDALVFFGLRGVPPIRIFQSIASGLLGKSSYQGGLATAVLGGFLHFFIAFMVVTTYYLASRRLPVLVRHVWFLGPLYGLAVYLVMNQIVLPLSAAGVGGPKALPVLVNGILIHLVGVGLPSALFARAATPQDH
jgi:hypothetical protein